MTELRRIMDAVTVISPSAFKCADTVMEVKPDQLIVSLKEFLYWQCYVREFEGFVSQREHWGDWEPDMIDRLRAAHEGRACREAGWTVVEVLNDGRILARKGWAIRRFEAGHYINLDSALGPPQKDYRVAICRPRDSTVQQASWYFVFGETPGESTEGESVIRFYWNVKAAGAPELVRLLTRALNRFQIPFQFKLPVSSEGYYRRDAAVFYANRRYYHILAMLFEEVLGRMRGGMDSGTPLFTKKLADGLGFAESPGESFGMNRCEILAQALWSAYEKEVTDGEAKIEEFREELRKRTLFPERPWLNPPLWGVGAAREYEFPAVCA